MSLPREVKCVKSCLTSSGPRETTFHFWKAFLILVLQFDNMIQSVPTHKHLLHPALFAFNAPVKSSVRLLGARAVAAKLLINVQVPAHAHNLVLTCRYQ